MSNNYLHSDNKTLDWLEGYDIFPLDTNCTKFIDYDSKTINKLEEVSINGVSEDFLDYCKSLSPKYFTKRFTINDSSHKLDCGYNIFRLKGKPEYFMIPRIEIKPSRCSIKREVYLGYDLDSAIDEASKSELGAEIIPILEEQELAYI